MTVANEVDRVSEYIEATFQNLRQRIDEVVAKGLAYDLVIMRNGHEVHQVPVAVASAIAVISSLPPARLAAVVTMATASFHGYSFKIKPKEEPKKSKKK
jgi:hypothetical protein